MADGEFVLVPCVPPSPPSPAPPPRRGGGKDGEGTGRPSAPAHHPQPLPRRAGPKGEGSGAPLAPRARHTSGLRSAALPGPAGLLLQGRERGPPAGQQLRRAAQGPRVPAAGHRGAAASSRPALVSFRGTTTLSAKPAQPGGPFSAAAPQPPPGSPKALPRRGPTAPLAAPSAKPSRKQSPAAPHPSREGAAEARHSSPGKPPGPGARPEGSPSRGGAPPVLCPPARPGHGEEERGGNREEWDLRKFPDSCRARRAVPGPQAPASSSRSRSRRGLLTAEQAESSSPGAAFPRNGGIPPARQRLRPGRESRPGGERDGAQRDRRGAEGAGSEPPSPGTLQRGAGASDRRGPPVPGAQSSSSGPAGGYEHNKESGRAEPAAPRPSPLRAERAGKRRGEGHAEMTLCPKKGEERQIQAQVQDAGRSAALGSGSTTPAAGPAGSKAVPSDSSITPSITPVNQRGFSEFEVAGRVNNGEWRRLGRTDGRPGAPGRAAGPGPGRAAPPSPRPEAAPAGPGEPGPAPHRAGPSLAAAWSCPGETLLFVLRFSQKNPAVKARK